MENLRFIRERIRSCISCNEDQCPYIKERLDQHVLSQHSASSRPSISNHRIRSRPSLQIDKISPVRSRISFLTSDQDTSTTGLNNSNKSLNTNYKENLRFDVLEWSKDLPVYRNPNFENLKQTLLDELIEKIDESLSDPDKEMRDIKVKYEIDNFVDSLPTYSEEQGGEEAKQKLKENLLHRIDNIKNEHLDVEPKKLSFSNESNGNGKTKTRDMSTSMSQIFNNNGKRTSSTETNSNGNEKSPARAKKLADAEVQHSLAATPHYNNIFKSKPNTNINSDEDLFRKQIVEWFDQILDRYDNNEVLINKNQLVNNLFLKLKQFLTKNVNSINFKLTLKAKIFEFIDELPIKELNSDSAKVNNLAEDLANRMLCVKINTDNFKQTYYSDACLHECAMEVMGLNVDRDLSLKSSVYHVVLEQLQRVKFYHSNIINKITDLFFEKMSAGVNFGSDLKIEVFKLLKRSNNLCDTVIINAINSIVKQLKHIDISSNDNKSLNSIVSGLEISILPETFSIYQSEHTFREPRNNSVTSNTSRRSSILKKDSYNLYTAEKTYTDSICNVIKDWINTIPKSCKKSDMKHIKDTSINSLANDILDQVKIEQIAPETSSEKKKYITFFILRWLNKLEYFKDLNDVKPYVDVLIEKIVNISKPQSFKFESTNESTLQEPQTSHNLRARIDRWIQEQQSDIFCIMDSNKRNKIIQNFSQKIHEHLLKKHTPNETTKEIAKYLSKLIKPEEKSNINNLAESLYHEINNTRDTQIKLNMKDKSVCCDADFDKSFSFDEILKEFIRKYFEYYYEEDNPIAKNAYSNVFKTELGKLRTPSRRQAYDNFIENVQREDFLQDRLKKELHYTSIVSDWLMTIPVGDFFNTPENKSRAQKVDKIVQLICDSEENGFNFADEMYANIINELPIKANHELVMKTAIEDLLCKIKAAQPPKPCCERAYQTTSISDSDIQEQNLSDVIEEYVRTKGAEITGDDFKLDAFASHIGKEIEKTSNQDTTVKENDRTSDSSLQGHDIITIFNYKLSCVKEISKWLNNLPLQPITDATVVDSIARAINKLVEKLSEKFIEQDSDSLHSNTELLQFITAWISQLPLLSDKFIDMPTATQQLINRIGRVHKGKDNVKIAPLSNQKDSSNFICQSPHACCNKSLVNKTKNHDPATVIVETIEKWCNDLPVQADNEMSTETLKNDVARKIYQTVGEINRKPEYFNNDMLYERVLSDELDRQLNNLPQNKNLLHKRDGLKSDLIKTILENKNMIKEKASAQTYRKQLQKSIDMSMPYPVQTQNNSENYKFEIYKDRLSDKFILDNFDHSDDEVRINYDKKINNDINKYFQTDQRQNVVPLTKDEVNNQLFSALFQIVPPQNDTMLREVEEIKTKCEIENWFETLPLQAAKNDKDLLEWNKILTMLAKRLHEMEKSEKPNEKMHKEITKWLLRLPLSPGQEQNIDYFADELQARLKHTEKNRECNLTSSHDANKSSNQKGILGTSQIAGPSHEGKIWTSPSNTMLPVCCQAMPIPLKKPAELILEIVESWCKQLPLPANTEQEQQNVNLIKGNLIMKIIVKITELNLNPETFNNDQLYDALLEDELENLLSSLPTCFEFIQNKNDLKSDLVVAINSVKSLIKEDNSRYEYKQELRTTVERVLKEPKSKRIEQISIFYTLRDEIVDNFIEYSFSVDDDEKQQLYKGLIRDNVANCCELDKETNKIDVEEDSFRKGNQLICELCKVPSPGKSAILEEVQEIRLKSEIAKLFNILLPCAMNETDITNKVKATLAKRINDYEKVGYTNENKTKIKSEIIRCLEKLQANIDHNIIDKFVEDLQKTETVRRVSVTNNNNICDRNKDISKNFYEIPQGPFHETKCSSPNNLNAQSKECESQWISLLSATPLPQDPYENAQQLESLDGSGRVSRNVDQSKINYQSFERNVPLSSSILGNEELNKKKSNQNCTANKFNKNNMKCNNTCPKQKQMLGSSNTNCSHSPDLQLDSNLQCQIPGEVPVDQSYNATQTKLTSRYQQTKLTPMRLDCTSEQSLKSVPNCQNPQICQQQSSQSYTAPTSVVYPQTQTSISDNRRTQQQSHSIPFSSNLPQRRASLLNNSGRPCRRPSITIVNPDEVSPENHNLRRLQQRKGENDAVSDNEDDLCPCERRKPRICRGNSSGPNQQKYCRICNGFKPYYCGPSPYRYPGFYYY